MLIKKIHGWELPENMVTPESVFLNRRQFVTALGVGAAATGFGLGPARAEADPSAGLYPVETNPLFKDAGREVTRKEVNIT
ncbi:MAG: twin-arginine translocation signal domain-containing protein, partial [Aestuariivirgaceae bacterium]